MKDLSQSQCFHQALSRLCGENNISSLIWTLTQRLMAQVQKWMWGKLGIRWVWTSQGQSQLWNINFWMSILFCLFWDRFSCIPDWSLTYYVAKDDFELLSFLPQPPEFWAHICETPHSIYAVMRVEPRASCMLRALHELGSKNFTHWVIVLTILVFESKNMINPDCVSHSSVHTCCELMYRIKYPIY